MRRDHQFRKQQQPNPPRTTDPQQGPPIPAGGSAVTPPPNRRVDGAVDVLRALDDYKRESGQFGSASVTLNYGGKGCQDATVSDTIRLQPGMPIGDAVRHVLEWLEIIGAQETETSHDGHGFQIIVEMSGNCGTIQKARTTRSRIDAGPAGM
jgi:hypothetical protein